MADEVRYEIDDAVAWITINRPEARNALSPLVGAWYSEFGALNRWIHIWAYRDAAERQRIRAEAVAKGLWPPGGAAAGAIVAETLELLAEAVPFHSSAPVFRATRRAEAVTMMSLLTTA